MSQIWGLKISRVYLLFQKCFFDISMHLINNFDTCSERYLHIAEHLQEETNQNWRTSCQTFRDVGSLWSHWILLTAKYWILVIFNLMSHLFHTGICWRSGNLMSAQVSFLLSHVGRRGSGDYLNISNSASFDYMRIWFRNVWIENNRIIFITPALGQRSSSKCSSKCDWAQTGQFKFWKNIVFSDKQ